jgi:hypothetical protein
MQDKYAGDVGDFGKYILLKQISSESRYKLRLGINWYYCNLDEPGSTDGKHVDYLFSTNKKGGSFSKCDPKLYRQLSKIVNEKKRSIRSIEKRNILPKDSVFFSIPIPDKKTSLDKTEHERARWFDKSINHLNDADILFLDPDNGVAPENATIYEKRAVKYSFLHEIKAYYAMNKSVIVYNHRDRSPSKKYFGRLRKISDNVDSKIAPIVLRFQRVSVRDYLILPQPHHKNIFSSVAEALTGSPYDFLFKRIDL